MAEAERATKGSRVKLHYRGTLADGEEFDSNLDGEPLEFRVGDSQVIEGFERAVMGMTVGEEKTFTVSAEDGYGAHDASLLMAVPKTSLPADGLFVGIGVRIRLKDGRMADGYVTEIRDDSVTLDFNHPLAGKALTFAIKVVDVR